MNIWQLILQVLQYLSNFAHTLIPSFIAAGYHLICLAFAAYLELVWSVINLLPIPETLLHPTLPDPGPLGYAMQRLGLVQAIGIICAAFQIKIALQLIPFIGR